MQLGQPVALVVGVRVLGDRLARRRVVVLDDVANGGGEGDHRLIAGVGTAGGDLLDHRPQRLDRGPVAERGGHRRAIGWRGRSGSARWCPPRDRRSTPPANADGSPANQRAWAGDRSHVRAGRVEQGLATVTASSARPAMPSMLTCRRVSNSVITAGMSCERQPGDGRGGTIGIAAERSQRGGHHPGEEPQDRLIVGSSERPRLGVDGEQAGLVTTGVGDDRTKPEATRRRTRGRRSDMNSAVDARRSRRARSGSS